MTMEAYMEKNLTSDCGGFLHNEYLLFSDYSFEEIMSCSQLNVTCKVGEGEAQDN